MCVCVCKLCLEFNGSRTGVVGKATRTLRTHVNVREAKHLGQHTRKGEEERKKGSKKQREEEVLGF